jgi:hypothetical protein
MNDEFANRLGMYRTVKETLNQPEHIAVWQGNQPLAFGTKFNDFLAEVQSPPAKRSCNACQYSRPG